MKRILMALAAVAAMVGCSKENTYVETIAKDTFTVSASIVLDDTRVTVEGETFTDVKWSEGDNIQLSSVAGTNMTMTTTEISATRDRAFFGGEGELVSAVDTYYAIYPAVAIAEGVASIDLSTQSGDDAAVLVAKANSSTKEEVNMAFTPANALLHVVVSGVSELAKAEFMAFDGSTIASTFTYNFAEESASASGATERYTINNPSVDGFFFALPADLEMANGYIVTLTDAAGNVCTKAYNGKTFAKATTTRVTIEWSTPSVTLGTPMTSYSYYVAGNTTAANKCANNVIYSFATFSGIQVAMIAEAGYVVDGKYIATLVDSSSKSIGNVTVSSWGEKRVQAYIKTKDGGEYKSAETATVHITGLPYTLDITKNDGSWAEEGYVNWNTSSSVKLGNNQWGGSASISKSDFALPSDVRLNVASTGVVNGTGSYIKVKNTVSVSVSGKEVFSQTQKGKDEVSYSCSTTCSMSASNPSIKVNSSYNLESAKVLIKSLTLTYGN